MHPPIKRALTVAGLVLVSACIAAGVAAVTAVAYEVFAGTDDPVLRWTVVGFVLVCVAAGALVIAVHVWQRTLATDADLPEDEVARRIASDVNWAMVLGLPAWLPFGVSLWPASVWMAAVVLRRHGRSWAIWGPVAGIPAIALGALLMAMPD